MDLNDYISTKEKDIAEVQRNLRLLKSVDFPVEVCEGRNGDISLFTNDYSKATRFEINKKEKMGGGGYSTPWGYMMARYVTDFYPNFFFDISDGELSFIGKISDDYKKDKETATFMRVERFSGTRSYTDKNRSPIKSYPNSSDDVLGYFKKKGVTPALLGDLEKEIKKMSNTKSIF